MALFQIQQVEQKACEVEQVLLHGLTRAFGIARFDGGEGVFMKVIQPQRQVGAGEQAVDEGPDLQPQRCD